MRLRILFVPFLILSIGFIAFPRLASAQSIILSLQSGPWEDPATWASNAAPNQEDTVIIGIGHHIELPVTSTNIGCADLFISDSGALYLNRANFTVYGPSIVRGNLVDTVNAGINVFKGEARVERDGKWITPTLAADRLIFEGGFTNKGDTLYVRSMQFRENDQEFGGSNLVVFEEDLLIGSGVTLNMTVSQGLQFNDGRPIGEDSSSTFINTRFLYFYGLEEPMEIGQADFSQEGTRVYYLGDTHQHIKEGTYYYLRMEIGPEKEGGDRILDGDLRVIDYLLVDNKNILLPGPYNITVEGEMEVQGDVIDQDTLGLIQAQHLTLFGARFTGEAEEPMKVHVLGNLDAPRKDAQLNHVDLQVGDTLHIGENTTLMTTGKTIWDVHAVEIDSAGYLFSRADTLSVYDFQNKIDLVGGMEFRSGIHTFHDTIILRDSAFFQGKNEGAQIHFLKSLQCDGTFGFTSSKVVLHEDLLGTQPIFFSGEVLVAAGKTVRNKNTGGLTMQGSLDGEDENSVLINEGRIYLSSEAIAVEVMPTGKLDVLSSPDNWVFFSSGEKNQRIPGNVFQNLGIENNAKVLSDGNVEIKGDFFCDAKSETIEGTLDIYKFLLTGEEDQLILGIGAGSVENMEIAKASGKVRLKADLEVSKLLVMTAGIMETDSSVLSLGTGGQLEENANSFVVGKAITRRSVPAGSSRQFGGLGLKIRASAENALGETLAIRTTGKAYEAGQIERYFEIQPANNANLGASVEFTYDERDLTGAKELDLYLEHQSDQAFFVTLDASKIDTETNVLSQADINTFGILTAKPVNMAVNAYPSPLRDGESLKVEYILQADGLVNLNIFDRSGHSIARHKFQGVAGKNTFTLDEPGLAAGLYFVRIKSGRLKGYKTFIKLTD